MVENSFNRSMSTTVKVEVSICRAVSKNKRTLKYSSYFIDVIPTLLLCRRIKSIIFVQHILRDGQYFLNMLLKTKTEKISQSSQISFNSWANPSTQSTRLAQVYNNLFSNISQAVMRMCLLPYYVQRIFVNFAKKTFFLDYCVTHENEASAVKHYLTKCLFFPMTHIFWYKFIYQILKFFI